jgi:hypothetical protein
MQWTCTAHEGGLLGADDTGDRCFMKDTMRPCKSRRQCQSRVRKERRKLDERLHELADDGNPIFAEVASELPLPEEVLSARPEETVPAD